jgi:ATP-dependent Clp protease ATP-binding subunit ClpC
MVDRFSPNCRAALVAAEREARSLKHGHVGTEHVLLGLLKVEDSVAARGLRALGVTYRKARRRIVRLVDVGPARVEGPLAFTPRVREILEDAYTGALWLPRLGASVMGPSFRPTAESTSDKPVTPRAPRLACEKRRQVRSEGLLLALLAHGEGVAANVLSELGVDLAKAATATQHVRFPSPVPDVLGWPPEPPSPR